MGDSDGRWVGEGEVGVGKGDFVVVPVGNFPLEDLGKSASIKVQLLVSSGDRVKEGDGSQDNRKVEDGVGSEGIVGFLRDGNVTTSKHIVRQDSISNEFGLSGRGSNSTVGHLNRKLGLDLHLVHDGPVALGRIGRSRSVQRDNGLGGNSSSKACQDGSSSSEFHGKINV